METYGYHGDYGHDFLISNYSVSLLYDFGYNYFYAIIQLIGSELILVVTCILLRGRVE